MSCTHIAWVSTRSVLDSRPAGKSATKRAQAVTALSQAQLILPASRAAQADTVAPQSLNALMAANSFLLRRIKQAA